VPVYLLMGRADVNAMASLAEHYYASLQAPHKDLTGVLYTSCSFVSRLFILVLLDSPALDFFEVF
jgi:hypothetical protein